MGDHHHDEFQEKIHEIILYLFSIFFWFGTIQLFILKYCSKKHILYYLIKLLGN